LRLQELAAAAAGGPTVKGSGSGLADLSPELTEKIARLERENKVPHHAL
jgi:hypothetical protein